MWPQPANAILLFINIYNNGKIGEFFFYLSAPFFREKRGNEVLRLKLCKLNGFIKYIFN